MQQHILSPGSPVGKNPLASADMGLILGSGRSPGGENGNPLQYSCLEKSQRWRSLWATVHPITESDMNGQLSEDAHTY